MNKHTLTVLMLLIAALLFVSCDNNTKEPEKEAEAKTYTVTFDLNGGTGDIKAQTVKDGEKAAKPTTDPTPSNTNYYAFDCWTKEGETTAFDFANTAITSDTKLVAKWKNRYKVGDKGPAGGIIFYVAEEAQESSTGSGTDTFTWKYLEAAPEDITVGDAATATFCFGIYRVSNVNTMVLTSDYSKLGFGRSNTEKLVAAMGDNAYTSNDTSKTDTTKDYAAKVCYDYKNTANGQEYDDWYLPSSDELKELYEHKDVVGCSKMGYWSSSEFSDTKATKISFKNGNEGGGGGSFTDKYDKWFVRAIRYF